MPTGRSVRWCSPMWAVRSRAAAELHSPPHSCDRVPAVLGGDGAMNVGRRGAAVKIAGLRKEYVSGQGRVLALDTIDLNNATGEFLCIDGPSGCGKSTLLRILARLGHQSSGTFTVEAGGWSVANAMVF